MALAILGTLFGGLSGTSVQFWKGKTYECRVAIRSSFTRGRVLDDWDFALYQGMGCASFDIFKNLRDFGKLLSLRCSWHCFSPVLHTLSPFAISGVGIATVLQYVAPTLIIIYLFPRIL